MKRGPVLDLNRLYLDRLPGIDAAFTVSAQPGVNLICGPNEAGKSSVARAVFQLLWPDTPVTRPLAVRGEFTDESGPLQASRLDTDPVAWTRSGAPTAGPAVPGGHVARCYRLGLLDLNHPAGGDLDRDLAREIRKQMAGGFDLGQVRELFPDRGLLLSRRQKAWHLADQELQKCLLAHKQLAAQERNLADQEKARTRAQLAARRVDQIEAALAYATLDARGRDLAEKLAALPPQMDQIRPGDDTALSDLVTRLKEGRERAAELRENIARRAAKLSDLTVAGNLEVLAETLQQAELQSERLGEANRKTAAAAEVAQKARTDLAPEILSEQIPAASEHAFNRLVQAHRELTDQQVQLEFLTRLLADMMVPAAEDDSTEPVVDEAVDILAAGSLQRPGKGGLAMALGALCGAVLLFLVGNNQPTDSTWSNRLFGAVAVLALAGVFQLGQWLWERSVHHRARRTLEALDRAAGRPLPAGWDPTEALHTHLNRSREAGVTAGTNQSQAAFRAKIEQQQHAVQTVLADAASRRQELLRELGHDENRSTPGLLHELDQVARCRTAEEQLAAAIAVQEHDESRLTALTSEARRLLAESGLENAANLAEMKAHLIELRARTAEAKGLRSAQEAEEISLRLATAELSSTGNSYESLCQRLALTPAADDADALADTQAQLTDRVQALPAYQRLRQELADTRRDQDGLGKRLDAGDELPSQAEILAQSKAELELSLAKEQELADQIVALTESIVRTRDRVAQARQRDELEHAQAEAAERVADLAEALTEQQDNMLGQLLVTHTTRLHESNTQPPLLAAMNAHLGRFTEGRFRLSVTGDSPDRFVAINTREQRVELAALSDGTRAQLLLAARLAFLNGVESGLQVPLFLDEALTASDPRRFDAIARAVGRMAAETGRQIFYLTSNPADLVAWQRALHTGGLAPAHEIDLIKQRGLDATAPALTLTPPASLDVPAPGTLSAAQYGTQLHVPPLQPWSHENAVHVFHLWQDDLDLVHRLLVGGLATLGQWKNQGHELVQAGQISAAEAARIDARGQVYGAFLEGWQVGRGRPLTRDDLVASAVLSDRMLAAASALLDDCGNDAAVFMAGVQAGQVKRLQTTKKEALQEYLERHGHWDRRAIWPPDQIVAHVLGAVADALHATVIGPAEVRQLVLNLHRIATVPRALTDRSA